MISMHHTDLHLCCILPAAPNTITDPASNWASAAHDQAATPTSRRMSLTPMQRALTNSLLKPAGALPSLSLSVSNRPWHGRQESWLGL